MAFKKSTLVSGYLKNGEFLVTSARGHWSIEAAERLAVRRGMSRVTSVSHYVTDTSGKGRGGCDRRWIYSENGTKKEDGAR